MTEYSHSEEKVSNTSTAARVRGIGNGPVAGRFVLVYGDDGYVTSWDTWEEAEAAWPIPSEYRLEDGETGRVWHGGTPYEWEAAQT